MRTGASTKPKGVSKDGKPWQKIKTWFGYSLHLLADTAYEIPVAFSIQPASRSESKELAVQLDTLFTETPELRRALSGLHGRPWLG